MQGNWLEWGRLIRALVLLFTIIAVLAVSRNVHLREGGSEDVIKQAIADLKIDVVVMGSVARSGIPGLLIGNKAEKTLNTINCTVLTVKPDGFVSPVTLS